MVTSTTDVVLTPEELLSRSKQNAATKVNTAGMSQVEKLLAQRGGTEDIVDVSPVQKLLQQRAKQKESQKTPYTEQDWFLKLKVDQLRTQLSIYSSIPGLDPSGTTLNGIESEIRGLLQKQADKANELDKEGAAKQAALDKQQSLDAELVSSDDLLKRASDRASGIEPAEPISTDVQALLDAAKGSVDTTA